MEASIYPEVVKKDGSIVKWDYSKILEAVHKASVQSKDPMTEEQFHELERSIEYIVPRLNVKRITTVELHSTVMSCLSDINQSVYIEYKSFRNYKIKYAKSFKKTASESYRIVHSGDTENANKDSDLNSTKQSLISSSMMQELMKTFEVEPDWLSAHNEGYIHIHDIGERYLNGINCCLFNMARLVKDGFSLNNKIYEEPTTVQAMFAVVGDLTLSASAQQYGGFTIPEIDTIMAPYARSTYEKYFNYYMTKPAINETLARELAYERTDREIEKGYVGFETKLNTISNSLGQIPFVTVTFGLDTSEWARRVTQTILKVREGDEKTVTAIFPKLVFICRREVNRNPGSPNYDLYQQAIQCSKTRLYPDYLSLDGENNNLREVYERSGKVVSGMGCRAYLSPFYHPETGEEIYTGRMNIGAVSLNLVKLAIDSEGDEDEFFASIDKYSAMAFRIHEDAYKRIGKSKGSTNPLFFCEGGSWMSVGYDEPIAPIIDAATASLGYLGLEEVCQFFFGESLKEHQDFALKIVSHLKKLTVEATRKYDHLYALYATPAENLVYRFNKLNKAQYGVIENVTSREYETNSFHLHVTEDVSVPEKISFEAPFHALSTGGRISYCEFPYGVDNNVLQHAIDFAMDKGMYYGVNVVSSSCDDCNEKGDFPDECPTCGSENITVVERVCGYLSFGKSKGKSRFNLGKQAEVKDRVKHSSMDGKPLFKIRHEVNLFD